MNHAPAGPSTPTVVGGIGGGIVGGIVGGCLGGVGLAVAAGAEAQGLVVDLAFFGGALLGGAARWRWPTSPVPVVGVALFLVRVLWLQPLLSLGLVCAALLGAVCASAFRGALPAVPTGKSHVAAAGGAAAIAALVYGAFSVHRHTQFGTGSWDYGCYLHNAWLFAHGQAFSTTAVSSVLGDAAFWGGTNHFMPSIIVTAPLAWAMEATSSSSLLLIAQALVVCASVLPLAAVASHRGLPLATTTALVLAFLFHTSTQGALLFDVHEIAPVPLLLFTVLWIVETKKRSPVTVVVVLALLLLLGGTKESALLYAAAVGALLLLRPGWRDVGAAAVVFFSLAFVVVVTVVQPALLESGSKGMVHLARFGDGGVGGFAAALLRHPGQTLTSIISPDVKLMTIGTSAGGFGLLPLVSGEALVLALPNLAERFLSDKREMWGLGFHYGLVSSAFLAWGTLQTLGRMQQVFVGAEKTEASPAAPTFRRRRFDIFATVLLTGSIGSSLLFGPSAPELLTFQKPYYASDDEVARYHRALALIGDEDRVVAQNHFLAQLALREHIWLPEQRFVKRADVVILDTAASPWPRDARHIRILVQELRIDPRFDVVFQEESTWVFRRRPST